jgi:uncharacterized membrane protein SirB2
VERFLILWIHLIGFGMLMTVNIAGFILNSQYKKAQDIQGKATLLRAMRPIGILSPIAVVILLITGIGNIREIGLGVLDAGWLTAKIIFFAIAVISGILFGIQSGKRGKLVQQMAGNQAPADAQQLLTGFDRQITLSYTVMWVLIAIILALTVYGRLGGQ